MVDLFGTILGDLTGSRLRDKQKELLDLQLNALRDELQFSQAFGGVLIDKPFSDIEKTRIAAKKNIDAQQSPLSKIIVGAGTGLALGLGGNLASSIFTRKKK